MPSACSLSGVRRRGHIQNYPVQELQLGWLRVARVVVRVVIPGRFRGNRLVRLTELSTAFRELGRGSGRGFGWIHRRGSSADSALILLCYYGFVYCRLRLRR
jgi:hypothetical protein